jgi:hypothetical protein
MRSRALPAHDVSKRSYFSYRGCRNIHDARAYCKARFPLEIGPPWFPLFAAAPNIRIRCFFPLFLPSGLPLFGGEANISNQTRGKAGTVRAGPLKFRSLLRQRSAPHGVSASGDAVALAILASLSLFATPQSRIRRRIGSKLLPNSVREYSTFGGTWRYTSR